MSTSFCHNLAKKYIAVTSSGFLKFGIAFLLFFPIFFNLSGHIYRTRKALLDSGGDLMILPLPISIIGCYLGILLLGHFKSAKQSLYLIALTFVLIVFSALINSQGHIFHERQKLLLMVQYMLPLFAIVLGQTFEASGSGKDTYIKAIFLVLILIVPIQLLYTWYIGGKYYTTQFHSLVFTRVISTLF
ncbi:MAG: hypothetical protein SWH54_18890 [Thermodesulfobacteriota bacterium]|nr:hypothetical protein [Thermodesulfobacteriota bacterium]